MREEQESSFADSEVCDSSDRRTGKGGLLQHRHQPARTENYFKYLSSIDSRTFSLFMSFMALLKAAITPA